MIVLHFTVMPAPPPSQVCKNLNKLREKMYTHYTMQTMSLTILIAVAILQTLLCSHEPSVERGWHVQPCPERLSRTYRVLFQASAGRPNWTSQQWIAYVQTCAVVSTGSPSTSNLWCQDRYIKPRLPTSCAGCPKWIRSCCRSYDYVFADMQVRSTLNLHGEV